MDQENQGQNNEEIKNSQLNNLNKEQIIESEKNNKQIKSEEENQNNSVKNEERDINEIQNINDNNSDFISNNNDKNEEMEGVNEEEENNENQEQNLENENFDNNNNERMIQINYNNINDNKDEFNDEPDLNMNEQNLNMDINNEYENFQNIQQILNDKNVDDSVQNYIFDLHNKLNRLMNENERSKIINRNLFTKLNEINNKNNILNQKLRMYQIQNQKMHQEFIRLKQTKNSNIELLNLKNMLKNYENLIYQLNNDKIILESKLGNMQIQLPNKVENVNLLNYRNNKLIRSPSAKIPLNMKNIMANDDNQIFKNKIILLEKNNKKLSQGNNELINQNKYLQKENQKMFVDLKNKFNYIVNLKDKISEFKKEYHRQIDTFQKDNNQTQSQINQLFFERDQLIKENSEMKNELNKLNYLITYQKSESNDRMKKIYEDKLSEYKNKIIILKNRINELLGIESHGNYLSSGGNSLRYGQGNLNMNSLKKNRSFKYNNLNILTDFNFKGGQGRTMKYQRKNYTNNNLGN